VASDDPSFVNPNPELGKALLGKDYPFKVKRSQLFVEMEPKMKFFHSFTIAGSGSEGTAANAVVRKGKLSPIVIEVESRGGKKCVTICSNLHRYNNIIVENVVKDFSRTYVRFLL
jgi:hypothetical protein